ncbi:MAG: hypothetical protein A2452_01720 [Candidatus Firestonebacteria bacterium RIFOXYC2_FULL_39_67]|nr:MAG: hypothetical protein A2536_00820 [Candidatus Firestonebacteria bacterium RIFOXYD2_FULL_39_29]OGF53667.1 MAG: hypothetical protein A2452_01720 [Candidatus Firestonebacteria bacterium RIFOXYC2_FULL_39_67]OGF55939.1 MAG: hypothetical protein A2497_01380 [Candidatus Firestonebacteria bacterium RifOxyC12_full_39_7]
MLKVEKTNAASEKYNEIHYINLDLVTRVKFTVDKIEFMSGSTESATFTKKEVGDAQFENIKLQLEK